MHAHVEVDSLLAAVPTTGLYTLLSAFGLTVDSALGFSNHSQQKHLLVSRC